MYYSILMGWITILSDFIFSKWGQIVKINSLIVYAYVYVLNLQFNNLPVILHGDMPCLGKFCNKELVQCPATIIYEVYAAKKKKTLAGLIAKSPTSPVAAWTFSTACRGGLKLYELIILLFLGNYSHLDPIPSQLLSMHNNLSWPHKKSIQPS